MKNPNPNLDWMIGLTIEQAQAKTPLRVLKANEIFTCDWDVNRCCVDLDDKGRIIKAGIG